MIMLPSEDPNKKYFTVTMTNIGKRPIFVSLCGIIPEQKKGIKGSIRSCIMARQLPKMLKEGEYLIEYIEDYSFGGRGIIGVFANDSTGKEWRASKKNIKMVIEQLNEHRND